MSKIYKDRKDYGSYYSKKSVSGDNPLLEIIYELENAVRYDAFRDLEYIPKSDMRDIIVRHDNTVKEFKEKLARMIN